MDIREQEDEAHKRMYSVVLELIDMEVDPRVIINASINNMLTVMKAYLDDENIIKLLDDIKANIARKEAGSSKITEH